MAQRDETFQRIAETTASLNDGIAVFTGAGMSTDSGLPDFRSAKGIWNKMDPMELATESAMRGSYDRFYEFYALRLEQMKEAAPNGGHRILADWETRGLVSCVITQNVDGLHTAAGSKNVFELHGSVEKVRCMDCALAAPFGDFMAKKPCARCGGLLRPGVVLFSESLPEDALDGAWDAAGEAKVFIVLGSSLQVSPANYLPVVAKRAGAVLVICNHNPTPLDNMADYVTNEGIADFLAALDSLLPAKGTERFF